jgi:hexosaminidase
MRFVTVLSVLFALRVQSLWPIPRSLQTGTSALKLHEDFDIRLNVQHPPQDLLDAVSRTKSHLINDRLQVSNIPSFRTSRLACDLKGTQRLVVGRGAADNVTIHSAKFLSSLELSLVDGAAVKSITEESKKEITSRKENYALSVPKDGSRALLMANSTLGLLRGLTTFEQLWYYFDGKIYTLEAPAEIADAPAYVRLISLLYK